MQVEKVLLLIMLVSVNYHFFDFMNEVCCLEQRRHHSFDNRFDIAETLSIEGLSRFIIPSLLDYIGGLPPFAECALKPAAATH